MDFLGKFNNMQATGIAKQSITRRTEKKKETQQKQPAKEQKTKKQGVKDKYTSSTQGQSETPKTHRRKTQQVVQHFVASTDNSKESKKLQNKQAKEAQNARDAQEAQEQKQPQQKTPLDNSSRIGLMYQQKMRNKKQTQQKVDNRSSAQVQQQKLKKFMSNMRKFVKTEYQQYTKPEISPYSRRNLREILSALGEETKAFDNKAAKDRKDRQNGVTKTKSYNKHFAARATKSLKLFTDDPMQDPNYTPFEMSA